MTDPAPSFEERLYTEYDLKGRIKLIIILSAILYVSFMGLDAIYAAEYIQMFLIIRLVVLAAHIALFVWVTRIDRNRNYVNAAIALAIFDVAGIAVMIHLLGGFASTYVQGLYIIVIGLVVAVPLTFRDTTGAGSSAAASSWKR
jgi:hypothetical protein